jgi:two-component system C4-dicarboxylate transport sensor histidine kinase DctB
VSAPAREKSGEASGGEQHEPPPPSAPPSRILPTTNLLASAHERFAKAALTIYLGAAALAVALFVVALVTDRAHEDDLRRELLLVETDIRAHALSQHLGLLIAELRRLGVRSEVDLVDQNLAPERSLLQLSHERSAFFNLGVGILDRDGKVVWAEPRTFLEPGTSLRQEPWFSRLLKDRALRVVPVDPSREDAVLYVVSPIARKGELTGALLGAIDLARGGPIERAGDTHGQIVLTTFDGAVVYPPKPPAYAESAAWRELFAKHSYEPVLSDAKLNGASCAIAVAPVAGVDLLLLSVAPKKELFRDARTRFVTRLALGLALAIGPLVALVLLLNRSLKLFRQSEEDAMREDRLRLLGAAANAIAHEVKNGLNGISMGIGLVTRKDERPEGEARRERVMRELRHEIQRLADFTRELMTFSKGIEPQRVPLDLVELIPKVTGLVADTALEDGIDVQLDLPEAPVHVRGDPGLLNVVISNLLSNAIDAISSAKAPRVIVRLTTNGKQAEVRVIDNGSGVTANMRARLFEPFQTGKPSGVGIGLSLSQRIARAHQGELSLESSARGEGTTMLLSLPKEEP